MRIFVAVILFVITSATCISQRYIHNVPEAIISVQNEIDGSILALSASGRLFRFDGAEFTVIHEGIIGPSQIMKVEEGYLITSSSSGIWKWVNDQINHQPLSEIAYSYSNIDNKEYVLTPTGMLLFKEGRYQLVNDWTEPITEKAKFYSHQNRDYLINGNTVYHYKSGDWKVLARDTIGINDIAAFNGELWLATDSGLRIAQNKKLKEIVIDESDMLTKLDHLFVLGDNLYIQGNDNLLKWSTTTNQAHRIDSKSSPSNVVLDNWGDLWYADEGNIIQQKIASKESVNPIFSYLKIYVNDIPQDGNEILVDKENSDIKIEYLANHLRQPNSIKYQSRLTPRDEKYQELTSNKSIVYSDVPAGNYNYRLRATIDGINYTYHEGVTIKVKPLNQISNWWWILGGISVGLLFLAILSNYRLQQYKERSSLLTEKLRTTNELLTSQQKTMQLQMNPHFLFNALNSIQGLVVLNRNEEAKTYLRKFSRMMRSVLDFSTVDTIDLKTELDYLNDYLSIEKMTRSNSFNFEINVEESLLDEDIQLPPMILQPFVENAIVHGVSPIKNGEISIDIKDEDSNLLCIIKDNGIGLTAANQKKKSNHKSVAVSLAKERLRQISTAESKGGIYYKELEKGTQVEIYIPIF